MPFIVTLLGTGGLVRAYGQSAKEGLAAAGLIERTLYKAVHVKTDYNMSGIPAVPLGSPSSLYLCNCFSLPT